MVSGRPSRRRSRCRSVAASSALRNSAFSARSLRASLTSLVMKTPNAIRSESVVRLWNTHSSSAPSGKNWNIAHMLEIDGEGNDFHRPLSFALVEAAAREFGHIKLDRLVETVDAVVHPG